MTEAEPLLTDLSPDDVFADDKGYDSDDLRDQIRRQGAKPVIPSRQGMRQRRYDKERYIHRNVVERFFNRVNIFAASPPATRKR
ncbi:MAG: transposase [Planctomycetaceae bacterium]|nr:transposase [Planctomycetaceae bacterium]